MKVSSSVEITNFTNSRDTLQPLEPVATVVTEAVLKQRLS